MKHIKLITTLSFIGIIIASFSVSTSMAYPPFLKQVKDLGYDAKECTFCHDKAAGGKGWNKRGLWLKEQKKEKKAPVVDVRWLKNYHPEDEAGDAKNKDDNKASEKPENK